MPKSRKRKTRRPRKHSAPPQSLDGAARRRPEYDELGHWLHTMLAVDAAEMRGDAAEALRLIESRPEGPDGEFFWSAWRVRGLAQLFVLETMLPRWAFSRWMVAQALRRLDGSGRGRSSRALGIATRIRGGRTELPGVDDIDAKCRVMDSDWVFRQVFLYELGGLEAFLRAAAPDLVTRTDRIHGWARVAMGGYLLLGHDPSTVIWQDLATGESFGVANNGCGVLVVPGECVIGRRVPVETGSMFETVPLVVPQHAARQVARSPSGWIDVLADAREQRAPITTGGHGFELLTDVPPAIWMSTVLGDRIPLTEDTAASVRIARGAMELARVALEAPPDDPDALDPWPCLAASMLEPGVTLALSATMRPGDEEVLRRLSELLAEPASAVCRDLLEPSDDAA